MTFQGALTAAGNEKKRGGGHTTGTVTKIMAFYQYPSGSDVHPEEGKGFCSDDEVSISLLGLHVQSRPQVLAHTSRRSYSAY